MNERADLLWYRFHPVTPFIKGWKLVVAMIAVLGFQGADNAEASRQAIELLGLGGVALVLLGIAMLGTGYALVAWRVTRYAVDSESVYLKTGVLFRQQRSARLDRIQAIDVVQPLLARISGLAELKIEVAGGANSAVRLSFLKEPEAQVVRNHLLARAAGVHVPSVDAAAEVPVAPEREVLSVPAPRLLASLVRSVGVLVSILLLLGFVVAVVLTRDLGPALGMFPAILGVGALVWQRFAGEFGFRAATSPDGIRLRHGLLESRSQTVPPGRVQAVRISQGPLWRGKDWWRVQMNVAGYSQAQAQQSETVLLPVGDREEALLALWLVLPDLGTADARALLDAALSGSGDGAGFVTSPQQAGWLDPLTWRRNGFALTDRALLVRRGRLVRSLVVVPHERTQSLALHQGPLQRRLKLVSFSLHSTPGPVRAAVPHLREDVAAALLRDQAGRARAARASAGPERWMTPAATRSGHR